MYLGVFSIIEWIEILAPHTLETYWSESNEANYPTGSNEQCTWMNPCLCLVKMLTMLGN